MTSGDVIGAVALPSLPCFCLVFVISLVWHLGPQAGPVLISQKFGQITATEKEARQRNSKNGHLRSGPNDRDAVRQCLIAIALHVHLGNESIDAGPKSMDACRETTNASLEFMKASLESRKAAPKWCYFGVQAIDLIGETFDL
jgi:hypothetical protein